MDRASNCRGQPNLTTRERAEPPPPIVGIVLAGGRSSRFGSDKLAFALDGRPLVIHVVDRLKAVAGVTGVVVVGPAPPAEPAWLPAVVDAGGAVVRDKEPFGGPLAGLAVGLATCPPDAIALVVAGDMPSIEPLVLGKLAGEILGDPAIDVAFLASPERNHPLPLAVRVQTALATAEHLLDRGERSLRAFLEASDGRRGTTTFDPTMLHDIDTPDDLDR